MIVVDNAAVVDALTCPEGSDELRARLDDEELHVPTLLDYEIVSALRGLTLGGHLSPSRAKDALVDFEDLPIVRWPQQGDLRLRVFQLRENLSAYDAACVALAEALECVLVTRDRRLARAGGHEAKVEVF